MESISSEEPKPIPLYNNTGLVKIAETDQGLANRLQAAKVIDERQAEKSRSQNVIDNQDSPDNPDAPPVAVDYSELLKTMDQEIRDYIGTQGYQWNEEYSEQNINTTGIE